jgi:uncharacterized protein YdaU (DUF1376 family)
MSFLVDKWLTDTIGLTPTEYLILHRLLCHQWRTGGAISNRSATVARLVGVSVQELEAAMAAIRPWFRFTEEGLFNDELLLERQRALGIRDSRRRGAESTNAAKANQRDAERGAGRGPQRSAEQVAEQSVSDTPSPLHSSSSPETSPSPDTHRRGSGGTLQQNGFDHEIQSNESVKQEAPAAIRSRVQSKGVKTDDLVERKEQTSEEKIRFCIAKFPEQSDSQIAKMLQTTAKAVRELRKQ